MREMARVLETQRAARRAGAGGEGTAKRNDTEPEPGTHEEGGRGSREDGTSQHEEAIEGMVAQAMRAAVAGNEGREAG